MTRQETYFNNDISSFKLFKRRHVATHLYAGPFFFMYLLWAAVWLFHLGFFDYFELGCIGMAVVSFLQVLLTLFCHWSSHVKCFCTSREVRSPSEATDVKVVPTPHNGSAELVRLVREEDRSGEVSYHFEFQKIKYFFDSDRKQFRELVNDTEQPLEQFLCLKGFQDDQQVEVVSRKFGENRIALHVPEFMELFVERATAPFFVFQVFCVLLWCLDEYWYYSLMTLFMLVMFEATLVHQQRTNMTEIRKMGSKSFQLQVYRNRKWKPISSTELVPGDICSIAYQKCDMIPCDLLLIRGSCIVDESMLTGESVPQMKESVENGDPTSVFNMEAHGRLHVLYGGTKLLNHTAPEKTGAGLRATDNGCITYVIRTGFSTSQGRLLRTIMYGVKRVTANNIETFMFIMFLLIFAIMAAMYVWIKGSQDPNRNKYKLFLECTLILTSVVPPELPIELSLAVNSSLVALSKLGIFCTEPFRIPFAGKVDVCCFDKTGTLTSDSFIVEGVAGIQGDERVCPVSELPLETVQVLASCHSLAMLDSGLVGDPLEKAVLVALDWTLTKGDVVMPKKGKKVTLKISQRHHFSSALKRMSAVVSLHQEERGTIPVHLIVCKGAPETLKPKFKELPENYDALQRRLACNGARILSLGYKVLDEGLSSQDLSRDVAEKELLFAGFLVITCPLKLDSVAVVKEIQDSSHHTVMITGDNALTACHVAKELKMNQRPLLLLFPLEGGDWEWRSPDSITSFPFKSTVDHLLTESHQFCLTGQVIKQLFSSQIPEACIRSIMSNTRVFARVSPKEKERIVQYYNSQGFNTLMCGDGTNDVGALKHAHVGVALMPGSPLLPLDHKEVKRPLSNNVHPDKSTMKTSHSKEKHAGPLKASQPDKTTPSSKTLNTQISEALAKMEEAEGSQLVRLGDASIASPFTSKFSSIRCICHVIRQGRCTLVTTLQMFKILALNALILAYCQSVLYLDGVKFSDKQATLQGLLLAGCFLFISRAKPVDTLSPRRPLPNILNLYTIATVLSQFACHFSALVYLVQLAREQDPLSDKPVDLEKRFEPSLVNSVVYIISITLQLGTFAVNYRGRPYMQSLFENKWLCYCIVLTWLFMLSLAAGWSPEAAAQFEIVDIDSELRFQVVSVLVGDLVLSFVLDRLLLLLFGNSKLRN